MSDLPKDYLKYPNRKFGQDHEFYDWRLSKDRPRLEWEGGAKVAICFIVPLEFFPLNPSSIPFKHPGAMVTPYPDLRHFTVRDYGNRIAVYRLLEAFGTAEMKASFAVNAKIAEIYTPLMGYLSGHEIIAHGLSTDHIHHEGLSKSEERARIKQALSVISNSKGWLSPARGQSSNTLELLAGQNVDYCLDWELDQVPVRARTDAGEITLIPNQYELSDFTLLHTRRQTEQSWLTQILNAVEFLASEHDRFGGQVLGLTLTPYIIGQPFRFWALRELLAQLNARSDVSVFTPSQIDQQFREQI